MLRSQDLGFEGNDIAKFCFCLGIFVLIAKCNNKVATSPERIGVLRPQYLFFQPDQLSESAPRARGQATHSVCAKMSYLAVMDAAEDFDYISAVFIHLLQPIADLCDRML